MERAPVKAATLTSPGLLVCLQFVCQPAGGSGIPEVIGFLNGTVMRHVLNMKAFAVKFFSCCCAVGAGLPVGPEGPMIHMGCVRCFSVRSLHINTCFSHKIPQQSLQSCTSNM